MSLRDKAILEIEWDGRTGVFVMREDLEDTEEAERNFLMAERGQYIQEIWSEIVDVSDALPDPADRRTGFHVDGGAGRHGWNLSWTTSFGEPDEQWGDGSSDPNDDSDFSKYDATGCHPVVKKQVFANFIAQSRTDSWGQATLHIGEWTDGTYSDESGIFGPAAVVIEEGRLEKSGQEPISFDGTLQARRTELFPSFMPEGPGDILDFVLEW